MMRLKMKLTRNKEYSVTSVQTSVPSVVNMHWWFKDAIFPKGFQSYPHPNATWRFFKIG